jgi:hypothetical protein
MERRPSEISDAAPKGAVMLNVLEVALRETIS